MFEWLAEHYLELIANYKILLGNPTGCGTVELLKLFSFTLLVISSVKVLIHLIVFFRMRRKFPLYREEARGQLFQLYRRAAQKVCVARLPQLYKFNNAKPLLFTVGSWRPAIFLAPQLIERLSPAELEAALVHELTHVKRHDNLLIWLMEVFFVAMPLLFVQIFALSFIFSIENSVYAILGALLALTVFKAFLWKKIIFLRELSCDDCSVDKIKDPLILASSLVNVWRLSKELPKYRWQSGLAFAQTPLPSVATLEYRVRRLLNYRRPWFKFVLGKVARITAAVLAIFFAAFLWMFYSNYEPLIADDGSLPGLHICSSTCNH